MALRLPDEMSSIHQAMMSSMAAFVALVALVAFDAMAQTTSAEARYIADHEAAIARFTPEKVSTIDQAVMDAETQARVDLERQMRLVLGPVAPKGFGPPKFNIASLFTGDMEFGRLDGLVFAADGGKTEMIVTTRTLFLRWLAAHEKWWDKNPLPQAPEAAIRTEAFFTQAINTDAAVVRFAALPLADADMFAYAMVGGRTQDDAPAAAGEVFVAAIRGARAFVANATLDRGRSIPACTAARAAATKKLDAATARSRSVGDHEKARDAIAADFIRCFAERAPKEPWFADTVRLARSLYDRMPVK
jgi:hypothetical protein